MDKLNFEVISKREFTGLKEQTYKITRKDNKMKITPSDIKNIVKSLNEQAKKKNENIKIMVRGLNGLRMFTLKGFSTDLFVLDEDDYFKGKVRDTQKFADFAQLQISIQKEID